MTTANLRGGSGQGNFHSYTDYDNIYVYDTVSYPTGNRNLAGTRVVHIDSISVTDDAGIASETISTSGQLRLYSGTARLEFDRDSGVGGTIGQSNGASGWSGGVCGTFAWSTVPTAPATIAVAVSGRSVDVTIGASSSSGSSTITGYAARYSTDGGTTWSAGKDAVAGVTHWDDLPTGDYIFQAYAKNARGSSAGISAASVALGGIGKRKVGGAWQQHAITRRKTGGIWKDVANGRLCEDTIDHTGILWSEDWSAGWDARWTDGDVTPQTITNGWETGTSVTLGSGMLLNDYDAQADEIKPQKAMTNATYKFVFTGWYIDNNDATDFSTLEWFDNTDTLVLTMKQINLTTIINGTTYAIAKFQPLYAFTVDFISKSEALVYNHDPLTGAATSEPIVVKTTGNGETGVLRLTKSNTGDDFMVVLGAIVATPKTHYWNQLEN